MAKILQRRGRPNLSEGTCQKFCKSNQNWESYGEKETIYFKGAFLQVPPLKQCARCLNYANNYSYNNKHGWHGSGEA